MTTLPQTTNVRLPRPSSGAIQLAGQGALGAARDPAATSQGANEIWRVIRSHIWMILIVTCIVSPVAGFGVNYLLLKYAPRYTAAGLIEVKPTVQPSLVAKGDLAVADPASVALEIRTQAAILRSESLFTSVLRNQNSEVRQTNWFRQFNNNFAKAKQDFEDSLTVTPLQDTKLVKIEFTYSDPDDCKTIVRELVDAHIEEQKKSAVDVLGDRSYTLNTVKIRIDARLKQITEDMRQKQINLNIDGGGIGRMGMKDMELSKLVQEYIEAQLMYEKAMGFYTATSKAAQSGQDPPGLERYIQQSYPYLMNDKYQLEMMGVEVAVARDSGGDENSRYKQYAKRYEMMEAKYNKQVAESRAKGQIAILEEMQQEVTSAKTKMDGLKSKVDALKDEIGDLNNSLVLYLTAQEEQRGLREQLKTVREQIENVLALQGMQSASTVQWRSMPEKPLNKSFPKLWITMTLAIALGLGLSLGVAFLREATDQSIRSPRDIAKVGQINLLGMIPDESDDPQSAGARLPVVIFDAPHSIMAESFRHIRTKLQHTASLDTTRSIMVTSPAPGDGKTTIACNLAAGLALNGRRILLVDANFRRPEIHKIFGLSNEQGFSDVLNAVAAFDEVIQETQVPNLAVMSAGPKPMNPTELFESQLLIDFIERALEEFDHVIFDSGPIMVVAEAQAMAPRVDGVISVVRAKTNNRGLLQRMRDELRRNKAEHLGVVLNAVRAQGGGYYARNIQTYYGYDNNGHG